MLELIGTFSGLLAVTGVILNNYQLWPCFVCWMVSNSMSAWLHLRKRMWSLAARDIVFFALAVWGCFLWTR